MSTYSRCYPEVYIQQVLPGGYIPGVTPVGISQVLPGGKRRDGMRDRKEEGRHAGRVPGRDILLLHIG